MGVHGFCRRCVRREDSASGGAVPSGAGPESHGPRRSDDLSAAQHRLAALPSPAAPAGLWEGGPPRGRDGPCRRRSRFNSPWRSGLLDFRGFAVAALQKDVKAIAPHVVLELGVPRVDEGVSVLTGPEPLLGVLEEEGTLHVVRPM